LAAASGSSSQAIMMQAAFGGVQTPQLALQQTSPCGHVTRPQRTPTGPGSQAMAGQAPPRGAQIPQLGLQHCSSGPHSVVPHRVKGQRSSKQAMPSGMHIRPQLGQQRVPRLQRIVAQGSLSGSGTQMPVQSAPPRLGSQVSRGLSTHL
jgi:hypothetical protein